MYKQTIRRVLRESKTFHLEANNKFHRSAILVPIDGVESSDSTFAMKSGANYTVPKCFVSPFCVKTREPRPLMETGSHGRMLVRRLASTTIDDSKEHALSRTTARGPRLSGAAASNLSTVSKSVSSLESSFRRGQSLRQWLPPHGLPSALPTSQVISLLDLR